MLVAGPSDSGNQRKLLAPYSLLTPEIRPNDDIWMAKRQIELREVRQMVERAKSENPEGSVVIVADKGARVGVVTQVMDQVKLAGIQGIAISAEPPN